MILDQIQSPADIKSLSIDELNLLTEEIKVFLIDSIEKTGGHLSSNLGTIELTLAMHYVFDSPDDTFVWDVGHQAYTASWMGGEGAETLRPPSFVLRRGQRRRRRRAPHKK